MKEFGKWIEGCTLGDVACILKIERPQSEVNFYDFPTKSIIPVSDVPWPVRWLLARYNKKHLFCSQKGVDKDVLGMYLKRVASSCKWSWVFRNEPCRREQLVHLKQQVRRHCNVTVDPSLNAWIHRLCSTLRSGVLSARRHADRSSVCNLPLLAKYALRRLNELGLAATANDKEAGFTLENFDSHVKALENIVAMPAYREIGYLNVESIINSYFGVCQAVGIEWMQGCRDEGITLGRAMSKSAGHEKASVSAKLVVSLKSHKNNGFVLHRNILAARFYLMAGMSRWLSNVVENELRLQVPHLLIGREEFVQRLAGAKTEAGDVLFKCDVGSFFMSGSAESLADGCCALFTEVHKKRAARGAVEYLIYHQWLTSGQDVGSC